jgi:hypothetical protein
MAAASTLVTGMARDASGKMIMLLTWAPRLTAMTRFDGVLPPFDPTTGRQSAAPRIQYWAFRQALKCHTVLGRRRPGVR